MERARVALPSVVKISLQLAQQRRVIGRTGSDHAHDLRAARLGPGVQRLTGHR